MRIGAIVILLLIINPSVSFLVAQDIQPLQSYGVIPDDFITDVRTKADSIIKDELNLGNNISKSKNKFLSKSTFLINELLLSGNVLFNDSATSYLNKIADILLKSQPEIRKKIRIYVVKSLASNAFTTHDGLIFFTTALLARIENEAQLAFILAHEITHYTQRHVITTFDENQSIFSVEPKDQKSLDEKIKAASSYSKKNEFTADSSGYILYRSSGYSTLQSLKALKNIHASHLPFSDKKFNPNLFFSSEVIVPNYNSIYVSIDTFATANENDELSTHPNLDKRLFKIQEIIDSNSDSDNKVRFIQSESLFNRIRSICRNEELLLLLNSKQYVSCIYQTFSLSNNLGEEEYKKIIAKALYGVAKYKGTDEFKDCIPKANETEGEFEQLVTFFDELSLENANVIAFNFCYNFTLKYKDEFISRLQDDLAFNLLKSNYFSLSIAKDKSISYRNSIFLYKESSSEVNKKEKDTLIKTNKTENNFTADLTDFAYADFDTTNQNTLKLYFDEIKVKSDKNILVESNDCQNLIYKKHTPKEFYKLKKKIRNKGVRLGIDSLIIVDPLLVQFDRRDEIKVLETEDKLDFLASSLSKNSEILKLEAKKYFPGDFTSNSIKDYNDMSLLNTWYNERLRHGFMDFIPLSSDFMDSIIIKNNTSNVLYYNVFMQTTKKSVIKKTLAIASSIVIWTIPISVLYLAQTNNHVYLYAQLFDLRTGKIKMLNIEDLTNNYNPYLLDLHVYDSLKQIKSKRKK